MPDSILVHDQFLGRRQARRQAGGLAVSWLVPTVPEHAVVEHTHPEGHFVLLLDGGYVSSARGAPEVATAPMLVYNPPGTTHRDRFRSLGGAFLTLAVSLEAQRRLEAAMTLPDRACVLGHEALSAAQRLADSHADGDGADALQLESLCIDLVTAAAPQFRAMWLRVPAWLRRARDYLHDDCATGPSLTDVATAAGVHPVYLARAFRQHFGCSPGDYLRRCRLNRAAALLATDNLSLAEVAVACGYCDQAHFSRAFGRAFAMSPGRYRAWRGGRGSADTRRGGGAASR